MGTQITPCLIIGAGVAGVSAAVWLRSLRTPFVWVARGGEVGGMLIHVHNRLTNVLGGPFPHGSAYRDVLRAQVEAASFGGPINATVERITRAGDGLAVQTVAGDQLLASAIILATGTRYRRLNVPGEAELVGEAVFHSASAYGSRVAGKPVAVVGGGDAGFENALILADHHHCHVTILLRHDTLRARTDFVARARAHPRILIHPAPSHVESITPSPLGARLRLSTQGRPQTLDVAALFVRIGVEPVLPHITPAPTTDAEGFLVTNDRQHTSVEGLFAAGDITHHRLRAIATATGHGATAAHSATRHLGRFGPAEP